jgi:hypothetical protein
MLQQKYFTPFSLLRIIEYFVKSRLSYGVSCFLDVKSQMVKLNLLLLQHLKSMFGLPINTSHRRLQLVLGEPDIHIRLVVRLLKNWHKYFNHFKEYPEKLRATLKLYFNDQEISEYPCDYEPLKARLTHENLSELNKEYPEHTIRYGHREFLKKYVFTYPNKRDFYLIRFFTNTTKATSTRFFPVCICGEDSDPKHGLDSCQMLMSEELRLEYRTTSIKLRTEAEVRLTTKETLYDLCSITFVSAEAINATNRSER